jgi:hypothetical protein
MQFVWRSDEDRDGLPGGRPRASAAASSFLIECRAGTGAHLRLAGATDWPFRNAAAAGQGPAYGAPNESGSAYAPSAFSVTQ